MAALEGARVAVIGGGLGGLTAARSLLVAGADVEVLEAAPRPGGVIRTEAIDGFDCENAANGALSGADDGFLDLATELGVEIAPADAAAKNRWIYFAGALRSLPTGPRSLITSDLLSPMGKLRLLAEPLRPPLRGDVTVAEFFRHRLGDEAHDRVVVPFVTGIFAGDTERLSLAAAFPRLAELASRGGLVRGMIAARRSGERGGGPPRIAAPVAGMGAVIDALAAELDSRVRLAAPVAAVVRRAGGVELTLASGVQERFEAAVLALPAQAAARIVSDADRELAELLATIETAPVAVIHLGYRRDQIDHPLDGFGFLVAPNEPLPILGAVFESSLWPGRAPDGSVLLRCMIGGARAPGLVDREPEELVELARGAVADVLGVRGEPQLANAVRWPRAIAQYTVGHLSRVERADELAAAQNAVLAGASYRGVAVNAICADAARVVRSVAQILATPLALLLAFSLLGCSGAEVNNKPATGGDGGDSPGPVVVGEPDPSEGYEVVSEKIAGAIAVRVTMIDPPAAWVTSPGTNPCKRARRAPVVVDTHGGVRGAAVWLEGVKSGKPPAAEVVRRIAYADCALAPRVQSLPRIGATLEIASQSERRAELSLRDFGSPDVLARFPLAPIGRVFEVGLGAAGVYEISGPETDPAWAVVSTTPYLGVTNSGGGHRFTAVVDGRYRIAVWHPPVAEGGEPLTASAEVEVAGGIADVEVALPAMGD